MAAATRGRPAKKAAAKPVPPPEPVEEELDEELVEEEFEEVEEAPAAEKPAGRTKSRASDAVTFGVAHLAEYLTTQTGKEVTTRELRTMIRRMARDGKGRVDREIVAGNRTRYDWPLGLKDPEVKQIVAAYKAGESTTAKAEALDALKERNAATRAAKAKATAATAKVKPSKKAATAAVEEVDDDEELDFEDED